MMKCIKIYMDLQVAKIFLKNNLALFVLPNNSSHFATAACYWHMWQIQQKNWRTSPQIYTHMGIPGG